MLDVLQTTICKHRGGTPAAMHIRPKQHRDATNRQILFYLCKWFAPYTQKEVANKLGLPPSTITTGVLATERKMRECEQFHDQVAAIEIDLIERWEK